MRKHASVLVALRNSLDENPDDADLRVHLASVLLEDGETQAALDECIRALQSIPDHLEALALAERAALSLQLKERAHGYRRLLDALGPAPEKEAKSPSSPEVPVRPIVPAEVPVDPVGTAPVGLARVIQLPNTKSLDPRLVGADIDRPALSLKDVGGLEPVKRRLETSFLGPLKNPELRRAYGKSLRGGLLLYGPPGCGKTFVARALAGELKAHFLNVGLDMVLDMYTGQSEKNLHELFESARRMAPCVVFFDEVDALGRKRVQLGASGGRGVVVQLLTELDGFADANDGVYCLAATNHPWDVDSALRRPGRFDRTVFVSPPDLHARAAILKTHLEERPAGAIDVSLLASQSSDFSGADLAHWVDSAVEFALSDSIELGTARPLAMADFERALLEIKPSTRAWFAMAKNYAQFANEGGQIRRPRRLSPQQGRLMGSEELDRLRARSKVLSELRRFEDVLTVLAPVIATDSADGASRTRMAWALLQLDRPAEALLMVEDALGVEETAWAHKTRGQILFELGRTRDAIAAMRQSLEQAPHWNLLWVLLSRFQKSDRDAVKALASADQAVKCDPQSGSAHQARGRALLSPGRYAHAEKSFRKSLALNPLEETYHLDLAESLREQGKIEEERVALQNAVRACPIAVWPLATLAHAQRRLGEHDEATLTEEALTELAPTNAENLRALGHVYAAGNDLDRARDWCERAWKLDPYRSSVVKGYAGVLEDRHLAAQILLDASRHRPSDSELLTRTVHVLGAVGRHEEARTLALSVREPLGLLADVADAARRPEWLADHMDRILALEATHNGLETQGTAALAFSRWSEAEGRFRQVLEEAPTCCCSRAGLGVALFEQGQREAAAACLGQLDDDEKENRRCCARRQRLRESLGNEGTGSVRTL